MLAASHALAGAIIASQVSSPELGYGLALVSHPLLDLFPHWDLNTRTNGYGAGKIIWTSLVDAGIGFGLGFAIFGNHVNWKVLLLTMFIAQLPDWLEAPKAVFGWNFPPFSTIKKLQHYWHTKWDWPWGFVPQVILFVFAFLLAKFH